MKDRETVLRKRFGLRLVFDKTLDLRDDKEAHEWLQLCEDLLGEAIALQVYTLPFHKRIKDLSHLKFTHRDHVMVKFRMTENLWLNKDQGAIDFGLSWIHDHRIVGRKFTMTPDFARTLASHLSRLADEMEGVPGPTLGKRGQP